jgi:flagellin-specific chaperone FliS
MGEAKRRKQILGKSYGQISFIHIKGERQFEEHFEKFCLAWDQKLKTLIEAMDPDIESSPEEVQAQEQDLQGWLTNYLQGYRPQDRERLVEEMLDSFYEQMEDFQEEDDPDQLQENVNNWVVEVIALFTLLKPHLSVQQQQDYAQPLLELYKIMRDEVEEGDVEGQQLLQNMFAVFLDVPRVEV